jgi:hypothetical protein
MYIFTVKSNGFQQTEVLEYSCLVLTSWLSLSLSMTWWGQCSPCNCLLVSCVLPCKYACMCKHLCICKQERLQCHRMTPKKPVLREKLTNGQRQGRGPLLSKVSFLILIWWLPLKATCCFCENLVFLDPMHTKPVGNLNLAHGCRQTYYIGSQASCSKCKGAVSSG